MLFTNNDGIYGVQFSNNSLTANGAKLSFEGEDMALDGSTTTADIYGGRIFVVNSQSDHFFQIYPDFGTPHDLPFKLTSIHLDLIQ